MPSEPKIEHTYRKTTDNYTFPDYGKITATTVFSSAHTPEHGLIGSYVSLIHPRTFGPDSPEVVKHNATKTDPQMELFLHHGPIIDNYGSHSLSGHTAPTVLGIAANISKAQFNEIPSAAKDLSKHSIRVAEKLQDSVPNYSELPTSPTNTTDRNAEQDKFTSTQITHLIANGDSRLYGQEVAEGSATIRQALRRRSKKVEQAPVTTPTAPTPTHEQLGIPGI